MGTLDSPFPACETKPIVNQIRWFIGLDPSDTVQKCAEHDIVVEAYSPFAHGLAAGGAPPRPNSRIRRRHRLGAGPECWDLLIGRRGYSVEDYQRAWRNRPYPKILAPGSAIDNLTVGDPVTAEQM